MGIKLSAANMVNNINDIQVFKIFQIVHGYNWTIHHPLYHKPSRHGPGSQMFAHRSIHTHHFAIVFV